METETLDLDDIYSVVKSLFRIAYECKSVHECNRFTKAKMFMKKKVLKNVHKEKQMLMKAKLFIKA